MNVELVFIEIRHWEMVSESLQEAPGLISRVPAASSILLRHFPRALHSLLVDSSPALNSFSKISVCYDL